jgi:hypothetical protein
VETGPDVAVPPVVVRDAAVGVLEAYVNTPGADGPSGWGFEDPGPLLVAALLADGGDVQSDPLLYRTVKAWLSGSGRNTGNLGLCGRGMAGFVLALAQASSVWPVLREPASGARARLVALSAEAPWRRRDVGWEDYDLILGPSGTLASLAADPACTASECAPTADHLIRLCVDEDLGGLRLGRHQGDGLRDFNVGRVNCGIGHGAPGVMAGLQVAARAGALPDGGLDALRRLATWLTRQSFVDPRGLLTWPTAERDLAGDRAVGRAAQRQAWCYGTPGIAWTLWEAAQALDDPALEALAMEAARTFLAAYDDDFYLIGAYPHHVGICHGAAGVLLTFDAFDRFAGLPGAAALRDHLAGYLHQRLEHMVRLAADELTMLSGASGVVAALLTYGRDGGRQWLQGFGLR